jgi:ribosome modulation factor
MMAKRKQRADKGVKRGKRETTGNGGDGRKLHKDDNGKPPRALDDERALFLHHRSAWNAWQAKVKAVDEIGTKIKEALKADGFFVVDMQIADDLAGSQEAKVRTAVERRLKVARWIGHPLGAQMDLFEKTSPTATADRAYDDGKRVGMEGGKPDVPTHFAAVHQEWLDGWYEGQEAKARAGIKPLDEGWDKAASSHLPAAAQEEGGL